MMTGEPSHPLGSQCADRRDWKEGKEVEWYQMLLGQARSWKSRCVGTASCRLCSMHVLGGCELCGETASVLPCTPVTHTWAHVSMATPSLSAVSFTEYS